MGRDYAENEKVSHRHDFLTTTLKDEQTSFRCVLSDWKRSSPSGQSLSYRERLLFDYLTENHSKTVPA